MTRWFRFYAEALDDPKVQRLSAPLFKAWVNMLCLASKSDGKISRKDVAFCLRVSQVQAVKICQTFIERGLLDETGQGFTPHNWNGRQFKSDVSTERVKRFRKRSKPVSRNVPDTDTDPPIVPPKGTFDAFTKVYPRMVAVGAARRAWHKLEKAGVDLEAVIAGAKRYAASPTRDSKFTKHPATWLNGECWLDEVEAGPQPELGIGKTDPETEARLRATEAREREISRIMTANPGMLRRDAIKALGANGSGRPGADSPAKAVGSSLARDSPIPGSPGPRTPQDACVRASGGVLTETGHKG